MLIVQPDAEADVAEARGWYENQRRGVGDEFLAESDRVFGLILRQQSAQRTEDMIWVISRAALVQTIAMVSAACQQFSM